MQAVVLAAGQGVRLGMGLPKALVPITPDQRSILDHQIQQLCRFVAAPGDIIVVVGYKKELIERRYPQLTYVHNDKYLTTNTGRSLLEGLQTTRETDVLWLNGDVVLEDGLISRVLQMGSGQRTSCVLVDTKSCGLEEIKYTLDGDGYIRAIGKDVKHAAGEALGVNFVTREDLPLLVSHLEAIRDGDYFERAMDEMIREAGATFLPVYSRGLFCEEIDFPSDLERVRAYLRHADTNGSDLLVGDVAVPRLGPRC